MSSFTKIEGAPLKWCAMCGRWGDHQSGSCLNIRATDWALSISEQLYSEGALHPDPKRMDAIFKAAIIIDREDRALKNNK